MTKTKGSKRSLLMSGLALLLCISMLIGSTFAWFTDSVVSSGNIIQSGTLDVEMFWADGKEAPDDSANWIDASTGPIFDYDLWEPGYTLARQIKIENTGSLGLKYQISIEANGAVSDLADVIDVYYADPAVPVSGRDLSGTTKIGTLTQVLAGMADTASGNLLAGENHTITLVLKMQESAGNEYQGMSIGTDFSVRLLATQLTAEKDTFDKYYDEDARYPLINPTSVYKEFEGYQAIVYIPAGAPAYSYSLEISDYEFTNVNGQASVSFDMNLVDANQQKVPSSSVEYPVVIQLPHPFVNMDNLQVFHNGQLIEDAVFDPASRTIKFETSHFSPFELRYVDYVDPESELEYTETNGVYTITKGRFIGKDPAEFDAQLGTDESIYGTVKSEESGVTHYDVVVAEKVVGQGTTGGVVWTLTDKGTLSIAPADNPAPDPNSGKTFESGAWREAVVYKANGSAAAIGGYPYDVNAVKRLIIEEGVTSIGSFTAKFPNLTGEVIIPSTVTYLGQEAFQNTKITKLTFAEGGTEKLCIAPGALKNLQIEEIVFPADRPEIHIHCWAFNDNTKLKHVTIPDNVTTFSNWTHVEYCGMSYVDGYDSQIFARCRALESISFGSQEVHDRFFAAAGNRSNINAIGGVEIIIQ